MSMKTRLISFLHASVIATLALTVPMMASADDDDPDITVYKEGKVPLKKPEMRLRPFGEFSLNSQLFTFPTGLRILMQVDRTHPVITVHSITDRGSADDFEGKGGLAHFVEHTWFKSQHDFKHPITWEPAPDIVPSLKIMDLQGHIGAKMNASTHTDITDYMTTASSEFKDLLMQYESWRLSEPYATIEESEIKVEVNVILNEWRRRNEQSVSLFQDYAPQAVYPEGHPYTNRSTKETLESITFDDLKKFFDDYYTPENTTIVVLGDFAPDEASTLIWRNIDWKLLDPELDPERDKWVAPRPGITDPDINNPDHWYVGAFEPIEAERGLDPDKRTLYDFQKRKDLVQPRVPMTPDTAPTPVPPGKTYARKAPVDKDWAWAIWPLPGGFREDHDAYEMLGSIVSTTVWWNLEGQYNARDTPKPYPDMDFGGCFTMAKKVNSMLVCLAEFEPKARTAEDAAERLVDQVSKMWDPNFSVQLTRMADRARNDAILDVMYNVDKVATPFGGRAKMLGEHLHYTGDFQPHSSMIKSAAKIEIPVLVELAEKHLKRNQYGVLHMQPMTAAERDTKANGSAYAGAAGEDQVIGTEAKLMATFDEKRIAESWIKPDLSALEDYKLENGLRVISLPHGDVPIVSAMLVIGGGDTMTPQNVSKFYEIATGVREPLDVLPIGGRESHGLTDHSEYKAVTALAGNLDGAVYALRYWADETAPRTGGLYRWTKEKKDELRKKWNSPGWHTSDVQNKHLYPNHPLSEPMTLADWDQFNSWGSGKIREIIDNRFRPENATLIVFGAAEADDIKKVAYEMFSSWEGKGTMTPIETYGDPDMPTASPRVLLSDDPRATQSTIRGRCRLNYRGPEDDDAVSVLSSLVQDDVFSALRVKEGLGYSPGGQAYTVTDGSAALVFYALATNAGVGRVVEYFQEWLDEAEAGVDPAKVTTHKVRQARESGISQQSVPQMQSMLRSVVENDKTWEEHLDSGKRIAAVQPEDISRLLKGCSDHMITTIVGPEKVIEPLLEDKDIPYEELEWKNRRDDIFIEQDPKGFVKFEKGVAKSNKKKKKAYTKACAKDSEARECVKLEQLIEDMEEEAERKAKRKAAE